MIKEVQRAILVTKVGEANILLGRGVLSYIKS